MCKTCHRPIRLVLGKFDGHYVDESPDPNFNYGGWYHYACVPDIRIRVRRL